MGSCANSGTNKCSIAQLGGRAVLMPSCLFNGGGSLALQRGWSQLQVLWPWKLKSADECVNIHLPIALAPNMDGV